MYLVNYNRYISPKASDLLSLSGKKKIYEVQRTAYYISLYELYRRFIFRLTIDRFNIPYMSLLNKLNIYIYIYTIRFYDDLQQTDSKKSIYLARIVRPISS